MKLPWTATRSPSRRALRVVAPLFASLTCVACPVSCAYAQAVPEIIGTLSGDEVTVSGAARLDSAGRQTTAVVLSGSEITVRSGQARIVLAGGGEIAICGPAHFSLLKSGDSVTVALDYGRVHPVLSGTAQITVFTPFVVAAPVAINQETRDLTVGLSREGALCAVAAHGAVRIEQQLSGQSVLVPQGGAARLVDGQLSAQGEQESDCGCDLQVTRSITPKQLELSVPAAPRANRPASLPPPPVSDQPVYMVYMPPISFDSAAPAPPPAPDPSTILLVRETHVQSEIVFRGHVEATPPAATNAPAARSVPQQQTETKAKSKGPGLFARIFGIFRKKRSAPCAGAGCSEASN